MLRLGREGLELGWEGNDFFLLCIVAIIFLACCCSPSCVGNFNFFQRCYCCCCWGQSLHHSCSFPFLPCSVLSGGKVRRGLKGWGALEGLVVYGAEHGCNGFFNESANAEGVVCASRWGVGNFSNWAPLCYFWIYNTSTRNSNISIMGRIYGIHIMDIRILWIYMVSIYG